MIKTNHKMNYRVFWKNDSGAVNPAKVIIISHGFSGGPQNSLIEYLSESLSQEMPELMIVTHAFGFFNDGTKPSTGLSEEASEINLIYNNIHDLYSEAKISLVGKSIGGIASLVFDKNYPGKVDEIIVLGWPMKIGYPINLDILSNNKLELPDYMKEYRGLLKSVGAKSIFVQGDQDDLAEISECQSLTKEANKKLVIINGANHGFVSPTLSGESYFSECKDLVARLLTK